MLSLGQAARLAGVGKTTLTRSIRAGRLSATRREDGSYEIDPSELSRVYSIRIETPELPSQSGLTVHRATPAETARDPETVARLAALEVEIRGLRELLDEVRSSRDEWQAQASRLVHALPKPDAVIPDLPRRPWWRRLAG